MSRRLLLLAAASSVLLIGASAGSANADVGDYVVRSCFSDRNHHSSRAFSEFATRGMRIRRACNPNGSGVRGLVVGNVARRRVVRRNARASVSITAAPGTVFRNFSWSGEAVRTDCAYGVDLYAAGPGVRTGRATLLSRSRAPYTNCEHRPRGRVRSSFTGRTNDVRGATRITQRVICKPRGRSTCSARGANYMKLQEIEVTAQDVQPPSVQITGGSLFDGWVRGSREVMFAASDNLGIASARVLVGGSGSAGITNQCDRALPVPCLNGSKTVGVDTKLSAEGTQSVAIEATDGAGLVAQTPSAVAHIDNTPPLAIPVGVTGGDGWRATNGFDASWANPAEADRAPITGAHFRLCKTGGQCEPEQLTSGLNLSSRSGIEVPSPGEWTLRMWREDAAGNADPNAASPPVTLRYDPESPKLSFDAPDSSDPTLVRASIQDALSGVASGGSIEMSREGSNTWQTLPTTAGGNDLAARIDDTQLPAGRYLLRASGSDNAGNRGTTTQRADGSAAAVTLPLRAEASFRSGFTRRRTVRRTVRRKGKRRVSRRRVSTLVTRAHVRQGEMDVVSGRLTTAEGAALPNAAVYVFTTVKGGQESYGGMANTDSSGRFAYRIRGDASRTLRLVYLGAPSIRPASQNLEMVVPAATGFRTSRRRLLNGQRVVFSGRLAAPPTAVADGKLVELQTRLSGRWQTFRTLRTDPRGAWRSTYRFRRTRGRARYRFRVRLPTEAGYPYGVGTSKAITIGVRGR